MQLSKGGFVAVIDGEHFSLFRNTGESGELSLTALPDPPVDADHHGAARGHPSSSANHDDRQQDEDGFAVGVADRLNALAESGKVEELVVIAAPRALGELRKHYGKRLAPLVVKEISKELAGRPAAEIAAAVTAA